MSNNDLKDNIVQLLGEVAERAGYINRRHPEKEDLSLDIDLVKDDLRRLYRQFELLKNSNGEVSGSPAVSREMSAAKPEASAAAPKAPPATPEAAPKAPAARPEAPTAPPDAPANPPETPATPSEASAKPPETPEAPPEASAARPEPPAAATETPETPPESPASPSGESSGSSEPGKNKAVIDLLSEYAGRTIGDQYLEEDNSVHQRISNQKEDKSIGTRMQQKPIASLKEAIGVNEKFLFINELFKGNIQAYNEAISRLNEMDDAKAAFDYLNELSMVHSWDANRSVSTIEKLADLVHRRHMSK